MKNDLKKAPPSAAPSNSNRTRMIAILVPVLLLVAYFLLFRKKTEEDRVRETIQAAAQAARDRHPANFSATLTEDFKTVHDLNKDTLHSILTNLLMFQYKQVEVSITPANVPVTLDPNDPTKAYAEFKASVTARTAPDAPWETLTDQAGGKIFKCNFRKTEKGWQFSAVNVEKEK